MVDRPAGFATIVCQLLVPYEPSIVRGGWQPPVAWGFETVLENSKGTLTKFPSTDCYHFTFIALEQPSIRVRGARQPPSARAGSFLTAVNARRIGFASLSGALTWRSNSPGIYFATAHSIRIARKGCPGFQITPFRLWRDCCGRRSIIESDYEDRRSN